VATGVVEAAKKVQVSVPIVVRLAGTNAELAAEILKQSGMNFLVAGSLKEAAERVTQAIRN
jgi:succinyl-CoA synthetase beta subunit